MEFVDPAFGLLLRTAEAQQQAGQDLHVVRSTARVDGVLLHLAIVFDRALFGELRGEDSLGDPARETATLRRTAGLQQDGMALRGRWNPQPALHLEERTAVGDVDLGAGLSTPRAGHDATCIVRPGNTWQSAQERYRWKEQLSSR